MEDDSLGQLLEEHQPIKPLILLLSICSFSFIIFGSYIFYSSRQKSSVSTADSNPLPPFHPTQTIIIDVEGAVAHPGIVKIVLPMDGSVRVADVIASSGGFLASADQEYISIHINQAQEVKDGTKLYIPQKGEVTKEAGSISGASTININTADLETLQKLSGIGSSRATTIIQYRPYANTDELLKKTSIPNSIIQKIHDQISF
jgi:competence ComEA-like helix-hairpin-helix protein